MSSDKVGKSGNNLTINVESILTISIVVYKDYADALCAVRSIEEKTSETLPKHLFIVDNSGLGDSNASKNEFCQQLARFNDVSYVDAGANLGFGKGHNLILPYVHSEYHAIVNPDIELVNDAFSEMIAMMRNDSSIGMTIPKMLDTHGTLQRVYRRELTMVDMFIRMFCGNHFAKRQAWHTMQDQDYSKPFNVPFGQGSFLVVRTDLLKRLNGFDDRYFMYLEDADLCKRVNTVSKLMYCPSASVVHKWEKGSHKNWKLFKIHVTSMYKYFKKWGVELL
ncbi:glycosyltransferase family 2 protein [Bifidobacterium olomucense]|uniref:Glycosyl transferase family 2 n=1 Tax=Bifidobacterium olomucense TaxID=2675324 RepID=A0A7Y0HYQ9_9BIFI|nr:glycosyltransferase family 2 protein [Bifidobacterium sp. DSM 109959]NMM99394.1 glycosyl transferase family 2 [Bifidobacterium sp. DSM 109959]